METSNKRQRPGWLPNLFDLIVIALVIALAVVFLVWKGVIGGSAGTNEDDVPAVSTNTVRYTLELPRMYGDSAEMIQVGDTIVDGVRKYTMGEVVSVEVTDYMTFSHDLENGCYRWVTVPDYQTATVVLESECTQTDTAITVGGGYLIRSGVSVQVRGPGYAASGTVVSVERGN